MGYIGCKNPCSVTAEDTNEIAAMTRRPTYNQDRSRCTEPSKNDQTAIGNLHVLANLRGALGLCRPGARASEPGHPGGAVSERQIFMVAACSQHHQGYYGQYLAAVVTRSPRRQRFKLPATSRTTQDYDLCIQSPYELTNQCPMIDTAAGHWKL